MRTIRKHPLVVALGLVVVGVVAYFSVSMATREYQANATVLLLSQTDNDPDFVRDMNLVLSGDQVSWTANVLADTMVSDRVNQRLRDQGLRGSYDVAAFASGQFLSVHTSGDSASAASADLDLVLTELSEQLDSIHRGAGTSPELWIDAKLLNRDDLVASEARQFESMPDRLADSDTSDLDEVWLPATVVGAVVALVALGFLSRSRRLGRS